MAMRSVVASVLVSLVVFRSAFAQIPDPYPILPSYWQYTNNSDTTTPFAILCPPGQSFYVQSKGYIYGLTSYGVNFGFDLTPGQPYTQQNNWNGAPWQLVIYGCGDSYCWAWTLSCSDPYGMGEYYTVSCYDENGDPAAAPAGTWYHLNGYADPADYPATATTAYSASTAGGILDPHRTTIGIGEQVSCWIANWEDREWDNTTQEYVYDALGSVNWTTDNEYATVSPNVGSTTTFTAPLLTTNDGNQDVTITMTAQNLGGTDTATGTVTFSVLRPSGVQVFTHQDVWTSDPQPWSWAGADTVFFLQIEPTDVSFCNIYIREHILAATYPNWPNGNPNTSGTYISAPVKPEADNTGLGDKMGDCVNLTYFWNGTNYTNYSWTLEGNSIWWYEYLDRNGGYSQFAYPTDTASFTASTETLREVYSGVAGSAQGPFQTYHTP